MLINEDGKINLCQSSQALIIGNLCHFAVQAEINILLPT